MTEDLGRLYHGCVENVNFTDEQGVHVYDVALTKNTNSVKIVLQHLSGRRWTTVISILPSPTATA